MRRQAQAYAAVVLSLAALCTAGASAQIPDEFTNLELLDKDIGKRELISIMRDWTTSLGVRCNHCHVGPDTLIEMDFASDEKATKQTARRMFEMARAINRDLLANLPVVEKGVDHQNVSCYTCHRGQAKPPRNIVVEVTGTARVEGIDAALAHYDALRSEHYGSGVYDFSDRALAQAAGRVLQSGHPADAIKILEKVVHYNPESADSLAMIGMIEAETGTPEAAKAAFETWLDPANFDTEGRQKKSLSDLTRPILKAVG